MMAWIKGEVQWAKLTGLQNDQITPDFADAADGGHRTIVAMTTTSGVMKYHWAAYVGLTCPLLLEASECLPEPWLRADHDEMTCRCLGMEVSLHDWFGASHCLRPQLKTHDCQQWTFATMSGIYCVWARLEHCVAILLPIIWEFKEISITLQP